MTTLRRLGYRSALLLALAIPATAQSAANFDVSPLGSGASAASGSETFDQPPASRYAGADAGFAASRAETLVMAGRATDPFGYLQDPQAKPPERKPVAAAAAPAAEPPVALREIVQLIEITAVMPKERQFLVGTRMISLNDRFPVTYQNKNYELEVVGVTAREVTFRHTGTGETASSFLAMLPPGMSKGNPNAPARGMNTSSRTAPLLLDNRPPPHAAPPMPR